MKFFDGLTYGLGLMTALVIAAGLAYGAFWYMKNWTIASIKESGQAVVDKGRELGSKAMEAAHEVKKAAEPTLEAAQRAAGKAYEAAAPVAKSAAEAAAAAAGRTKERAQEYIGGKPKE